MEPGAVMLDYFARAVRDAVTPQPMALRLRQTALVAGAAFVAATGGWGGDLAAR